MIKNSKINLKDCKELEQSCWFDQFIEGGLDNTGTSFRDTNQIYTVTLNDRSTCQFTIASATGWTDQVNQISLGLAQCMPWAVESIPYCTVGCGGLPSPFIELPDMLWRYSGFKICPGDKFPIKVVYTSNRITTPKVLVLNTILSNKIYLDRCSDCDTLDSEFSLVSDGSDFIPFCPKPCGEPEFILPAAVCSFTFKDGCDQGNIVNGVPQAITLQYVDCGEGEILSSIYILDTTGGLEEYTPVGPIDNCDGEVIIPPEPVIIIDEIIKKEICTENKTVWQVTMLNSEGKEIITYEDETGIIEEPVQWTIGKCCCDDCCKFTINTNRNGIQNSAFYSNFEWSNVTGDTWADFIVNYESQGGTLIATSDNDFNVTNFQLCNLTFNFPLTYEDSEGIRQEIITSCSKDKNCDTCIDCSQGDTSSLCVGGKNEFYPISGYSTAHTYDYVNTQTSEDISNLLGCQGEFSPVASVIGINLFYDFTAIPDCATINSIKVRHVGGNSSSDNVYHLHNPSTGALIPIDESTSNRVWHRSNTTTPVQGTIYNHVGEYPGNTFPTPAGRFESEINVTTPLSVADLKNDFVVRLSAINTPDVVGCTKVIVDYTTDTCSQEELIVAGCATDPIDANLVKICTPTQTVTDCAGNESTVEALPTTVENIVNVRICEEPISPECMVDYFVGCDDVNGDGSLINQYLTPIQTCSLNGTITSQVTLDIVDGNLNPYTLVNPIICNPSTLDFTEQVYCDGVNSFIRRTILVGTVGATIQELELDGVTPYTPMGTSTLGPCDNGYQAVILEDCVAGVPYLFGIDALTGTLLWSKPSLSIGMEGCCPI